MLPANSAQIVQLPDGVAGIRETLKIMRKMVRDAKRDHALRAFAASLCQDLPSKAWRQEISCLFYWVQQNVRFLFDTTDMEVIQTPQETLRTRIGDCDDLCVLLATLLEAIGHPTGFRAVGFIPDSLSHVIVLTIDGGNWVCLDPSVTVAYPGWCPPGIAKSLSIFNG